MIRSLLFLLNLAFSVALMAKPIEIVMWHSLAGHLGEEVSNLVKAFNKSQANYVIKPVYKGEYTDSLTSFAAAFRASQPPGIIQVFEVGTATMLSPSGIIKPLEELMNETGIHLPLPNFLPAVRAFYSKSGEMQAMPFNTSVPLIFYNADALEKVGIKDKASFPKTWDGMELLAAKLKKAGFACGYTTSYPAWIQIESFSALHGLAMVDPSHTMAIYNNQAIIHHLERLKKWQGLHYFEYGGRTSDATILFTSGRCAMFSQSSGSYVSLHSLVKFRLGVAALPLDESVSRLRHNNVIGGAALWAVTGQSKETYQGIATFYQYIAQTEVQQLWHKNTGYIPLSHDAHNHILINKRVAPTLAIAKLDLAVLDDNQMNPYKIPQNQIRTINDEALEAIFSGIKSPQKAMNDAVRRANFTLMRFRRNTGED